MILAAASTDPIAPLWLVGPLAVLAMLAIAAHVLLLWQAEIPPSRRRIRLFNGVVMLFGTPIAAYAFGVVTPAQQAMFQFAWLLTAGLLLIVLLLAILDALNSIRLHWNELRRVSPAPDPKRSA